MKRYQLPRRDQLRKHRSQFCYFMYWGNVPSLKTVHGKFVNNSSFSKCVIWIFLSGVSWCHFCVSVGFISLFNLALPKTVFLMSSDQCRLQMLMSSNMPNVLYLHSHALLIKHSMRGSFTKMSQQSQKNRCQRTVKKRLVFFCCHYISYVYIKFFNWS